LASFGFPAVLPDSTTTSFSFCMSWFAGPVDPHRLGLATQQSYLEKIASAANCGDAMQASVVKVALDYKYTPCTTKTCSPTGELDECGLSHACGPPLNGDSAHCVSFGGSASCVESSSSNCSGTSCSGTKGLVCPGRLLGTFDCSVMGLTCVDNGAACGGDDGSPICSADQPSFACEGTHVRICASNFYGSRFDCAAVGQSCATTGPGGSGAYCATAKDCDPFAPDMNTCDGAGGLTYCANGRRATFACSTIGKTCAPGDAAGHGAFCQ
jgi:hypothetical protein